MPASTVTPAEHDPAPRTPCTLLELVGALAEAGATDREVVTAVVDLLHGGRLKPACESWNELGLDP